ncbi:MAG: helix-loop-helix domain-containing protein, partial [Allorhizobium sp.]
MMGAPARVIWPRASHRPLPAANSQPPPPPASPAPPAPPAPPAAAPSEALAVQQPATGEDVQDSPTPPVRKRKRGRPARSPVDEAERVRRMRHNASERKRAETINQLIMQLKELIEV